MALPQGRKAEILKDRNSHTKRFTVTPPACVYRCAAGIPLGRRRLGPQSLPSVVRLR